MEGNDLMMSLCTYSTPHGHQFTTKERIELYLNNSKNICKQTQIAVVGLIDKYKRESNIHPEKKEDMNKKINILTEFVKEYFELITVSVDIPTRVQFKSLNFSEIRKLKKFSKIIKNTFEKIYDKEISDVKIEQAKAENKEKVESEERKKFLDNNIKSL